MENKRSNSDMVNKVATDYWIYSEYSDGFGKPLNAFFTPREGDDLRSLQNAGEPEGLIWAKSELKLNDSKNFWIVRIFTGTQTYRPDLLNRYLFKTTHCGQV